MVLLEYLPWGGRHSDRALSLVSMLAAGRGGLPASRGGLVASSGGLGSSGRDIIPANMELVCSCSITVESTSAAPQNECCSYSPFIRKQNQCYSEHEKNYMFYYLNILS
jgi:hypothetical protein